MNVQAVRKKSISLTFRGFELSSAEVVSLVGVAASRFGNRGEPVKPGVKAILSRSYVIFSLDFSSDFDLCDMLPALLAILGGVDRVSQVKKQVVPEFLEVNFDLPVASSEDSQDGYLSTAVISDVLKLDASLSFSFF